MSKASVTQWLQWLAMDGGSTTTLLRRIPFRGHSTTGRLRSSELTSGRRLAARACTTARLHGSFALGELMTSSSSCTPFASCLRSQDFLVFMHYGNGRDYSSTNAL